MGIFLVFNEAHNGYLEITAQLGIIGALGLLMFLATSLFNTFSYWVTLERLSFHGAGALMVYLFAGLALSNITESLYFQAGMGSFGTLIFLAAFVAGARYRAPLTASHKAHINPRASWRPRIQ